MDNFCATSASRRARINVDGLVFVSCPAESAFLLNLSEGGMSIQTMDIMEPGRSFDFSIELPQRKGVLAGQARVVWSDRSGRAGLQFVALSPWDRLQLVTWMASSYTVN